VAVLAAIVAVGCSSRPAVIVATGEVKYAGTPLKQGVIRFLPLPGTAAPATGAHIRDGRYTVSARGGLMPGRYRVEIESQAASGTEPALPDENASPPQPMPTIPAAYNSESSLEIVAASSPKTQTFDFDLREP
jgi:hypothetical protein